MLSGFLVSHVIWAEVDKHGSFRLGWFYARRVRRLLPAAVVVIVATAALQLLVASAPQRSGMLRDGQAALVYLSNWQFIADSRDYFAADEASASPFLHYWSLSIEEQFYVVLPLALLLLLRLRRHAVVVLLVLTAVVAGSVALQVWHAASDPTYAYYATGTRVYQLAAGVLLASITRLVTIPSGLGRVLSVVGLAGVVVVGSALVDVTASTRGLLATVASLAVIAGLFAAPTGEAARLLALRVPRYLGQVSYGTYLWHWPIILILRQLFDVGPVVLLALAAPVATGLAALSYEIFERPIRRTSSSTGPAGPSSWPASAPASSRPRWSCRRSCTPPCSPAVANPGARDLSALAEQAAWARTLCRPDSTSWPHWPTYRTPARRAQRTTSRRAFGSPATALACCSSVTARRQSS